MFWYPRFLFSFIIYLAHSLDGRVVLYTLDDLSLSIRGLWDISSIIRLDMSMLDCMQRRVCC